MSYLIDFDYFILLRLIAAVILGGIIGLERGGNNHDAGLRTHIIVCLGAASVMVVSESIIRQYGITAEIMRMGAQVISGVGFLGIGSIFVDGNRIRGITTAAGLWTTACIGLAVGSGYYIIAAAIVVLMLFAMLGLRSLTVKLQTKSSGYMVKVNLNDREALKDVLMKLMDEGIEIKSVKLEESLENDRISVILEVKVQRKNNMDDLICKVTSFNGVQEFISM